MPVVINEFEVVSEGAPPQSTAANDPAAGDKPKPKLEPSQLLAPLSKLHQEALRVWTH
jgi:hypothetical protein